jgi:predicted ATPase
MQKSGEPAALSHVFVGRQLELTELRQGLTKALSGEGSLFLLSGEAGIGKTRLAEELSVDTRQKGGRVIWVSCWKGDGAPAFWPWVQVFRECLASDGEQLRQLSGSHSPTIADLVPEFGSAAGSSAAAGRRQWSDPQEARFQLFASAALVLKSLATKACLMIVLDDLHQADQASLLMLRFIGRELKKTPLLILGTFRETEVRASPALHRLIGEIAYEGHQIALRGLSHAEVAQMVKERVGGLAAPALVSALMEATAGNPLFVDALLRTNFAEFQKADDNQLSARDFKLPDGVHEAIRQRLSFLSQAANRALAIGAVSGQEFDFECLSQVACEAGPQLIDALDEARRDGLLFAVLAGNLRYRFAHDLIREAIYYALPAAERLKLHWQVAQALQQVYQAELSGHCAEIAYHYRESVTIGSAAKAIDYSIMAGEAATHSVCLRRCTSSMATGGGPDGAPRTRFVSEDRPVAQTRRINL